MEEFPKRLRLASPADEPALVALLDQLEIDNGFGIPKNPDRVLAQIQIGTERRGGLIGVIDGPDGLIASVSVYHHQFWYSDQWHLAELWLFVRPEHRAFGFERDLFQFAKWAREELTRQLGYDVTLITSVSSPRRLLAKTRLWRKMLGVGARHVGSIFVVNGA